MVFYYDIIFDNEVSIMRMVDLIIKKRNGGELTDEEIMQYISINKKIEEISNNLKD